MPPKVLLLTPPYHSKSFVDKSASWMPLSLYYLAGALRAAGHDVVVYDAMSRFASHDEVQALIRDIKPDVLGLGCSTPSYLDGLEVVKRAKSYKPGIKTVLGGVYPTFAWNDILEKNADAVDFVVCGEGETTIAELVTALHTASDYSEIRGIAYVKESKIFKTPPRPLAEDLDKLPVAWDLVDWPKNRSNLLKDRTLAVVSSSRGCVYSCTFCNQHRLWDEKWRGRDPEKFVDEIKMLNNLYDVNAFMIADEIPTHDKDRWVRILDLLIEARLGIELLVETRVDEIIRDVDIMDKYRQAGVAYIYLGIESHDQDQLDRFGKDLQSDMAKKALTAINKAGIVSGASFMIGGPDETMESLKAVFRTAEEHAPDFVFYPPITPWPNTDLYKEVEFYIEEYDFRQYDWLTPVLKPLKLTRDELSREVLRAYRRFYFKKIPKLPVMASLKREYMAGAFKLLTSELYGRRSEAAIPAKVVKAINRQLEKVDLTAGDQEG